MNFKFRPASLGLLTRIIAIIVSLFAITSFQAVLAEDIERGLSKEVVNLESKIANAEDAISKLYPATRAGVIRLLDRLGVTYQIDQDGDLIYQLGKNNWHGYIIFGELGQHKQLWNLQVRTQFDIKPEYYRELLGFANKWNLQQKVPKIAIKAPKKLILSINYPVQFGFNRKEFEVNVFRQLNRSTAEIVKKIAPMIQTSEGYR